MPNDFSISTVSIRPFRLEELAEILAIQFDEEVFPTITVFFT